MEAIWGSECWIDCHKQWDCPGQGTLRENKPKNRINFSNRRTVFGRRWFKWSIGVRRRRVRGLKVISFEVPGGMRGEKLIRASWVRKKGEEEKEKESRVIHCKEWFKTNKLPHEFHQIVINPPIDIIFDSLLIRLSLVKIWRCWWWLLQINKI